MLLVRRHQLVLVLVTAVVAPVLLLVLLLLLLLSLLLVPPEGVGQDDCLVAIASPSSPIGIPERLRVRGVEVLLLLLLLLLLELLLPQSVGTVELLGCVQACAKWKKKISSIKMLSFLRAAPDLGIVQRKRILPEREGKCRSNALPLFLFLPLSPLFFDTHASPCCHRLGREKKIKPKTHFVRFDLMSREDPPLLHHHHHQYLPSIERIERCQSRVIYEREEEEEEEEEGNETNWCRKLMGSVPPPFCSDINSEVASDREKRFRSKRTADREGVG